MALLLLIAHIFMHGHIHNLQLYALNYIHIEANYTTLAQIDTHTVVTSRRRARPPFFLLFGCLEFINS